MLYDTTHSPMARQNCDACHNSPQDPTEMHAAGSALCASCHAKQVAALTRGRRVHAAVTAGAGCLNCHTPHASAGPSLVRGGLGGACGNCHADTIARQALSAGRHQPVADGKCSACHEPHAGNTALLFKRADTMKLCGACHDWKKHTTHPLGPMFKDPRNRNLTLDCLSCHRAHGTPYDNMLPYPKANMLCVECHADYQR
jgi:predicted CXXCH cytochrome family protein